MKFTVHEETSAKRPGYYCKVIFEYDDDSFPASAITVGPMTEDVAALLVRLLLRCKNGFESDDLAVISEIGIWDDTDNIAEYLENLSDTLPEKDKEMYHNPDIINEIKTLGFQWEDSVLQCQNLDCEDINTEICYTCSCAELITSKATNFIITFMDSDGEHMVDVEVDNEDLYCTE